ncbi:MAG: ATP-binding protein, partial [Firmicutes bacterium]|nr:ATP-binding protein [Bacillota bacterium]
MIKVLEKHIADKIAAGEVVDRPVSIVKELVENSVDAGATSIVVEMRSGGKSYLRVTDDGCGIPADQVETAFLRHATSKIAC